MATMNTTKGELDSARLQRAIGIDDRPEHLALWIEWSLDGELVRRDAFPLPAIERGPLVFTTLGHVPIGELTRTIALTENDDEYAIAVMWQRGQELVRRDAHVILKRASVVADAIAASVG